jgi:Family of unknown function (DUF6176)
MSLNNYELIKVKLKANSEQQLISWGEYLNKNIDEVILSLKNEGVKIECWFYEELDSDIWLYCFWAPYNSENAKLISKNSKLLVDEIHKKFKSNCWDKGTKTNIKPILLADNF